jgi:putative NADH-flavin reductase
MKVLVIGAAGRTGKAVVERAVAAGHQVTSFARDVGELDMPGVRVVEGDATDENAVEAAIGGQDAVLDTVGGTTPYKQTTLETSVAKTVIAAMERNGVSRLVARSMLGVGESRPTRRSMNACLCPPSCAAPTRTSRRWRPRLRQVLLIG